MPAPDYLRRKHPAGPRSAFPASIADPQDTDNLPERLRQAHERNYDVLERIYTRRRFRTDTERLEKLFGLCVKMTAEAKAKPAVNAAKTIKA
ncbi:MAG: hypothetical protein KF778_18120 [Rhodocyclaceae bacterium]|nr:hypothetical protein [Rhodocyclaceae bacterium]MBX3670321.1 hypothetical protein [Rhodocyclaceae bacterium]